MDPVTAFSLAAGVLQVVDVGFKAIKICRELYKSGSLAEYKGVNEVTEALGIFASASYYLLSWLCSMMLAIEIHPLLSLGLVWSLDTTSAEAPYIRTQSLIDSQGSATRQINTLVFQSTPACSQDDLELVELSKKCSRVADDLQTELRKLKLEQSGLKMAIKKSFRVMRKRESLKAKQDLLGKYKGVLDTRILLRLDTRALRQNQNTLGLDQRIQILAQALEQGHTTVDQLLAHHSRQIQDHIDKKFESFTKVEEENQPYQQFLESLFFPEIESRQEQIPEVFENTCSWIFDSPDSERRQWPSFRDWLVAGQGVYWISGKPGSGKSTLMKYLINEDRTQKYLNKWKGDTDLHVVSFFFWRAGTALQKSATGLLRSLVYQIAKQRPDFMDIATGQHDDAMRGVAAAETFLAAWTDHRLLSILTRFLDQKPRSVTLCAFVDGLDEFVGDEDLLLNIVRLFSKSSQCKLCVSSRPEQVFRHEFKQCSQLRVQDLNRMDIEIMAHGKLIPRLQESSCIIYDGVELASLLEDLIEKASGVFLWLDLMVKSLIRGARNGDTIQDLRRRLLRTPETIQGVYAHILDSLDPVYQEERIKYFGILSAAAALGCPVTTLKLVCGEGEAWERVIRFDLDYFITYAYNLACRRLETRLVAACGDLVEVTDPTRCESEENLVEDDMRLDRIVDFTHRTALDYVRERYKTELQEVSSYTKSITHLARGSIGSSALTRIPVQYETWHDLEPLLDLLRSVMSVLCTLNPSSDVDESSESEQVRLTGHAFDTLQNMYSAAHNSKNNLFDDAFFVQCMFPLDLRYKAKHPVKDRLGCAAFLGCSDYVQYHLSKAEHVNQRISDIFRCCIYHLYSDDSEWDYESVVSISRYKFWPRIFPALQQMLQYNPDPQELFNADSLTFEHDSLWGAFLLRLIWRIEILDYPQGNQELALESSCLDLIETLLSQGSDPNTRIRFGSLLPFGLVMETSPLALVNRLENGALRSKLEMRLRSAGSVYHERFLFATREDSAHRWYRLSRDRARRLREVYYPPNPLSWRFSIEPAVADILWDIEANTAADDDITEDQMRDEIKNLPLSYST
ncbi:MAG: hypothetical protein Q9219_007641 [cf. Caloplaca sp. 3 TL-2023]